MVALRNLFGELIGYYENRIPKSGTRKNVSLLIVQEFDKTFTTYLYIGKEWRKL